MLAAAGSRFLVRASDGSLELWSTGRTLVRRIAATAPSEAALSTRYIVVHGGGALQVYAASSGAARGSFRVPPGKLVDTTTGLALLTCGRTIELVRLRDGRIARLRVPGSGALTARIEGTGLFYASGRRVAFVPMKSLLRRFR